MKKRVSFIFLFLLVLSLFFISSANESVSDKAYSCVEARVDKDGCSELSTEEKIFTLLAIGECKSEVLDDSYDRECWPKSDCSLKTTAQAVLALGGSETAEEWLNSKNITFEDLDWFLQVESTNATSCTATYSDSTYSFSVNEDKTLNGNAGSCLKIGGYTNYWFTISPSCYNQEIKISCDDSFITSLLYKKTSSSTIYVSEETHSASGEGSTTEEVNSYCFSNDKTECDYEGTLWSTIVLKSFDYNVSYFLPYLVSMADENTEYIPESFLYTLTNDFRVDLLLKQKEDKWWLESGDKFYDTAVALLPFQNENPSEKSNSKNWLEEIQDEDGCWQGNLRNTAFLLYSLWPRDNSDDTELDSDLNCEGAGYYCMSSASCSDSSGDILSNYKGCFGTNICCDKPQKIDSCSEMGGELCSSNQECIGGETASSSDSTSSKVCCLEGNCGFPEIAECEQNDGICKTSCSSKEEISSYGCYSSDVCCVVKKANYTWLIILLIILIILTVLGIVFRKKLREVFFKVKTQIKLQLEKMKKGKNKKPSSVIGSSKLPSTSSSKVYPGAIQRRILPPQQQMQRPRPPTENKKPESKAEFDDILKKLKDIGK